MALFSKKVTASEDEVTKNDVKVDDLDSSDLLSEADVYWTYGKWGDAMQIYAWWIMSNTDRMVAPVVEKYLDCCVKAMDFESFGVMMERIMPLRSSRNGVTDDFLRKMAVIGVLHKPDDFNLIAIAEAVGVEESRLISIAEKVVEEEKTPVQKKAKLWSDNKFDAKKLSSGDLDVHEDAHVISLIKSDKRDAYEPTYYEQSLFGNLCGVKWIADSAADIEEWKLQAVIKKLDNDISARPLDLVKYIDYLQFAHAEGMKDEYARILLVLFSILYSANAGDGLKRRLLAAGKILGQQHIFELLSGSSGKSFLSITKELEETGTYVPDAAWRKSEEYFVPLITHVESDDGPDRQT
jgi:hypothetical protein